MNEARRKTINEIIQRLGAIQGDLGIERDAEQEYYDNMPENMQGGEKGQAAEAAADSMGSALDSLEEAVSSLENIE